MNQAVVIPKPKGNMQRPSTKRAESDVVPGANASAQSAKPRCTCGGGCPRCGGNSHSVGQVVQAKRRIGAVDDALEQEADRVSEQVLADAPSSAIAFGPLTLQRRSIPVAGNEGAVMLSTDSVDDAIAAGGAQITPDAADDMQQRFGQDFSHVRVHTGDAAHRSALALNAHAYTTGANIVFANGAYSPHSTAGRHLLAHELTHVVQQTGPRAGASTTSTNIQRHAASDVVQRDAADLGVRFNTAVSEADWDSAVRAVMEMTEADARTTIGALAMEGRGLLRDAAVRMDPAPDNRVVRLVEAVTAASVPAPAPRTVTAAEGDGVAEMSDVDKLLRALGYAFEDLGEEAVRELRNLLTPQAMAIMAGFVAAYLIAQMTPIGWVADGIALASLFIAAIFMGRLVFDVLQDLFAYFAAMDATADQQLRTAGRALARGVARAGIQIVILLLTRGIRGGSGGRGTPSAPPRAPPPPEYFEGVTSTGEIVRIPVEAIAETPAPRTASPFSRAPLVEPPIRPGLPGRAPLTPAEPPMTPTETPMTPQAPIEPPAAPAELPMETPAELAPDMTPADPLASSAPQLTTPSVPEPLIRLGEGRIPGRMPVPIPVPPSASWSPPEGEERRRDPGAYPLFWPSIFGPPTLFGTGITNFVRASQVERDESYGWEVRRELWARAGHDPSLMPRDFHAHHVVPLFLGGMDNARGNITFLPARLHLRGHGQLASQPQMAAPPPPLRPLSTNILQHPVGTRYELVGFK
jgi:hypothetical protein